MRQMHFQSIYDLRLYGTCAIRERTNNYTRTLTNTSQTVTTIRETPTIYFYDPLAQSFSIDARKGLPGAFVTKVDVFIRKAPRTSERGGTQTAIPLQLQIRELRSRRTRKGFLLLSNLGFTSLLTIVTMLLTILTNLEDLDDVLANPVTFVFEEPVYLSGGVSYAIVLLAECDNYEAFVSTT